MKLITGNLEDEISFFADQIRRIKAGEGANQRLTADQRKARQDILQAHLAKCHAVREGAGTA